MSVDFTPDGSNLGVHRLVGYARDQQTRISVDANGMARMVAAREFVDSAIADARPVYGLTTGLGSRVTETLDHEQLSHFSVQTLRGRAQAQGNPIAPEIVRGAMLARLNTLMIGASGASPELADILVRVINAGLTPVVGDLGSIGAGDLCLGATLGLALTGTGRIQTGDGSVLDASLALNQSGISPFTPGPKDGLVLANHSGFSASMAAFAVHNALDYLHFTQASAAFTLELMDANLSPIRGSVTRLAQHQAHQKIAQHLERLLDGSELVSGARSRKIQDPLSLRNITQVHGALLSALEYARSTVNAELNSVSDNPIVDLETRTLVSQGGYFSSELTVALEALCRALDMGVMTQLARISKLASARHSGLPQFLARPGADSNGFAPLLKIAESLVTRIRRSLAPVELWPSISAEGIEDSMPNAWERGRTLNESIDDCLKLTALELLMGAQGLDLKTNLQTAPKYIGGLHSWVRGRASCIEADRPLVEDLESLYLALKSREISVPEIARDR